MFKAKPKKISESQIREYKKLVNLAKAEEISIAEIILCTCSVSGGPRSRSMNIHQVFSLFSISLLYRY